MYMALSRKDEQCIVPLQNSDFKQADHLHMPEIIHNNFTFHLINSFASLHTNTKWYGLPLPCTFF